MSNLIFISSNSWLYFSILIICLYFIIKYKKELDVNNLIDYFVYMTNRVNLIILFFTFSFMLIFSIYDFTNEKIITFFSKVFIGIIYYSFLSYSVYFGLLLIPKVKAFFKDNDLFTYGFYNKDGIFKKDGKVLKK